MKRDAKDIASFMTKWLGEIDGYGKPYLFAEYGIVPDKKDNGGPVGSRSTGRSPA